MKPRLLDLFSGAGGAARGYQLAGWHVTGVDHRPQPRYAGDEFIEADALEYAAGHWWGFDAIHASPPCQAFTNLARMHSHREPHPDLLTPARRLLAETGLPYVIENVPRAPMRPDLVLCGDMFGLRVRRHRWFEFRTPPAALLPPCVHADPVVRVYGHPGGTSARDCDRRGSLADWKRAMGIDWMTAAELAQAIPPAYCEHVGQLLLAHLNDNAPAAATAGA